VAEELKQLIKKARSVEMTPEDREHRRRSLAEREASKPLQS
jgi:hypothetical protein